MSRESKGSRDAKVLVAPNPLLKIGAGARKQLVLADEKRRDELPEVTVVSSDLYLMSYEEMKKLTGGLLIVDPSLEQVRGAVNDPLMGSTSSDVRCARCSIPNCRGHYGLIQFEAKIYNPEMVKEIVQVLRSVCRTCSVLLLSRTYLEQKGIMRLSGPARLTAIEKETTGVKCVSDDTVENPIHQHIAANLAKMGKRIGKTKACIRNPVYSTANTDNKPTITYTIDEKLNDITVDEVFKILDGISDEDSLTLGFDVNSHPRNAILQGWIVIPPASRPEKFNGSKKVPNPISLLYSETVKVNNELTRVVRDPNYKPASKKKGKKMEKLTHSELIKEVSNDLFAVISRIIKNRESGTSRGFRFPGISSLFQGKNALIRALMMSKRSNECARSVLSTDPNLEFGWIGVPEFIAKVLTQRETVTVNNIKWIQELQKQGRLTHITFGKNRGLPMEYRKKIKTDDVLRLGDIVDRWMMDGDWVLFGRQPTLHKQSLMAYRAKIGTHKTINLHMSVTNPHNADFDGDEGSLYSLGLQSKAAAMSFMAAYHCVMSGQQNRPMMGLVYNVPEAAYFMTDPMTRIDQSLFNDCLMRLTDASGIPTLDKRLKMHHPSYKSFEDQKSSRTATVPGYALFSTFLPADFYYDKDNVTILDGVLVSGVVKAQHIGPNHGSMVQSIWKKYGAERLQVFMTDASFVLNKFFELSDQFSIGIKDCLIDNPDMESLIRSEVTNIRAKVYQISESFDMTDEKMAAAAERRIGAQVKTVKGIGLKMAKEVMAGERDKAIKLANDFKVSKDLNSLKAGAKILSGLLSNVDQKHGEKEYKQALAVRDEINLLSVITSQDQLIALANKASKATEALASFLPGTTNAFAIMTDLGSGAKGSALNVAQIRASIGQQHLFGKRLKASMPGGRAGPWLDWSDKSIESRGFIKSSYYEGITPEESFQLQQSGREGMLNIAVAVSDSGAGHHRLAKGMEDLAVRYDGSVRNNNNILFQPIYGGDGFDAAELMRVDVKGYDDLASFFDPIALANELNVKYGFVPMK